MGAVYEAIDQRLDTTVALKETLFADERLRKQFEREARLLARLHHPALPRVSDHFSEDDGQFLVMQFIPGDDLSEMMNRKRGPFPADQVLTWAGQLLDALDYLHTQEPQIIHRDIKPQNLKLTSRGQIILLDFGLTTTDKSKPALLQELGRFLVQQRAQGRRPLLVIDEGQNLSPQALEEVRLLSNLETEKSKLLQILVAGQPNLRETIASPDLEQFRQRVAVSYHLTALDAPDTAAYINYRLDHAALGEPPRFPPDAADLVHRRSGGVPRAAVAATTPRLRIVPDVPITRSKPIDAICSQ